MAGSWTIDRFPNFEPAVRRLTEQHKQLQDEPLHLALAYQPGPGRDQQDVYLFEVIGNRFEGDVSPDRELFEATFQSTPGFPMELTEKLHLVLTNPEELAVALHENWSSLREVIDAIKWDDYKVLHADEVGSSLIDRLRAAAGPAVEATHG